VKKSSSSKFIKDKRGLLAACGVKPLAQRNRFAKQIEMVNDWIAGKNLPAGCPPLPLKEKKNGCWLRGKVEKWNAARQTLKIEPPRHQGTKGKAVSGVTPKTAPVTDALPIQENMADDRELFDSPEEQYKRRLQFNLDIYLNPDKHRNPMTGAVIKLKDSEVKELRDAGMLPRLEREEAHEQIGGGLRGVSGYIRNHFKGTVCSHTDIKNWCRGDYLPGGCKENFPAPDDGGRFLRSTVDPWVEKHLVKRSALQALDFDPIHERELHERAKREFEDWEMQQKRRSEDNNYISVASALLVNETLARQSFAAMNGARNAWPHLFSQLPFVQALPEDQRALALEQYVRFHDDRMEELKAECVRLVEQLSGTMKKG
jgi:hypothetical protein